MKQPVVDKIENLFEVDFNPFQGEWQEGGEDAGGRDGLGATVYPEPGEIFVISYFLIFYWFFLCLFFKNQLKFRVQLERRQQ